MPTKQRTFALKQIVRLRELGVYDEILTIVVSYGASVEGLFYKSNTRYRSDALAEVMNFMRERYAWEYAPIAKFFGRIDGSTAKAAIEGHLRRAQANALRRLAKSLIQKE